MYETVLHESNFVPIFWKKALQKLINHFTKVKNFACSSVLALASLGCFKVGSGEFEARDNMSSDRIRHLPAQKQTPDSILCFLVRESNTLLFNKQHNFWQVFPKFYHLHQNFLFFWSSALCFVHIHDYLWKPESLLSWVTDCKLFHLAIPKQYHQHWNLFFLLCHFVHAWSDWRYSFLQCDQNSLAMWWTQHHLFQQFKSGLLKFPGGGITTFHFMVRMFGGARGKSLVGPLMVSTVNGHEVRIPSFLATSVSRDSLSSHFPCVERRDDSIIRADLICLSQMPPIWLAAVGFLIHLIKSPPNLSMKDWIISSSISVYAFLSLFTHSTKLVPLSECNTLIFSLQAITHLHAYMKEPLSKLGYVNVDSSTSHTCKHGFVMFNSISLLLDHKWAKHIKPTVSKEWCFW